jgi:hypothetical protein
MSHISPDPAMNDPFDAYLAAAMQDVPMPEGLSDRILARLAADRAAGAVASPLGVRKRRISRRLLVAAGGLATAAAAIFLAVWLGSHKEEPFSAQYVLTEAIRLFAVDNSKEGFLSAEKPAPESFPFSQFVADVRGIRWQFFDGFLDRRGVVYDLKGPGGTRARLYVVNHDIDSINTVPSRHPFTTAGCCASAWQEDGMLYVLVVQGDTSTYDRFLNLPRSPLA